MADIDKALPNVEQEITLLSDEQIVEEQLEQVACRSSCRD